MKTELLKRFKALLFLPLFILVVFTSCQNEETDITNPNTEETFDNASALAQSILNTVTLDGSFDNILDSANCISVNLPVTIEVNGITLTIESVEDFDELEDILDALDTDDDDIVFEYPITITLSNYEQVVINNDEELATFIDDCFGENEPDDDIECIDFQYPISISVFDANFDIIETIEINDDEELYDFINGLEGGVLASINFPVTMVLADGSTIEVTSNQQLEQVIAEAEDACDEDDDNDYNDDDCTEESVELALKECFWEITHYNGDDIFDDYELNFKNNDSLQVFVPNSSVIEASWTTSETEDGIVINLSELDDLENDLGGDWLIEDCSDDDEFNLVNGDITMQIEQDCEENTDPLGCFETSAIELCDENNDGFEVFNLYEGLNEIEGCEVSNTVSVTYHESMADAEANTNPIPEATAYTNTSNPQTVYVRIELFDNPSQFEVLEMNLILEDCSSTCSEIDVDTYLETCVWNVVSYNGSDDLIIFDFDFNNDGTVTISGDGQSITANWSTSLSSTGAVEVEFTNVNMGNIQAVSGNWVVVDCQEDRLEFENDNSDNMVMERQNCYSAEELFSVASECQWEVSSFITSNGNDETSNYDGILYSFYENEFALAENGDVLGYGSMEPDNTSSGQLIVLLQFYNASTSLGNYYRVESLTENEMVLTGFGVDLELVFSRNCDTSNQDGDTSQIKTWLYDGNWQITYSTMDSADNTTDYANVTFDFQEAANLIGTDGSTTATLNYEVLRDDLGNLRMVINYLGVFPYWQMDDDWYITEVLENRIELHYVDDDTNDEFVLVFEKML